MTEQGTLGQERRSTNKSLQYRTGATERFPLQSVEEAVGDLLLLVGTELQEQDLAEVLEEEEEIEIGQLN